jgi:hypothetical protein
MGLREQFICTVERDDDGRVLSIAVSATDIEGNQRRVCVDGQRAARIAGAAHDVLRAGGVKGQKWVSSRPIVLDQLTGAQLELLLRAVKPIRRGDLCELVGDGVASMSREEAAYWYAKSHQPGGLAALRVLLTAGS